MSYVFSMSCLIVIYPINKSDFCRIPESSILKEKVEHEVDFFMWVGIKRRKMVGHAQYTSK